MSFLPTGPASTTVLGAVKIGGGLIGAADGTAAVAFGTTGITAAAGNDGRFAAAEQLTNKGIASGYAPLDATSKVPLANLPASVAGALHYAGTWNASTNTPALASGTAPAGGVGSFYIVGTAGTTALDGLASWNSGDMLLYDGTRWDKLDGQPLEVVSVAGRTGVVVLTAADVGGLATVATSGSYNDLTNKPAAASFTSTVYTAAGAIAPTDDESVVNSASAVVMTLAAGAPGHRVDIKRYGAGSVAVTLPLDGTSQTINMASNPNVHECLSVRYNGALATWLLI